MVLEAADGPAYKPPRKAATMPVEFKFEWQNKDRSSERSDEPLIQTAKHSASTSRTSCYKEGMRPDGNCRVRASSRSKASVLCSRPSADVIRKMAWKVTTDNPRSVSQQEERWCLGCCCSRHSGEVSYYAQLRARPLAKRLKVGQRPALRVRGNQPKAEFDTLAIRGNLRDA